MIVLFRIVFFCASALSCSAAILVTASLFIPDRAPQSTTFLGISLAVTGVFLIVSLLLYGIQSHVAAIAAAAQGCDSAAAETLGASVNRLAAYLLVAGCLLAAALAVLNYAILARINQGFAVFS